MRDRCRKEIEQLHRFFEAWFTGGIEESDSNWKRVADALAGEFELICPLGNHSKRESVLTSLRPLHGSHAPGALRMWVANYRGRDLGDGLFLATYEEWHERSGERSGRISSATFRENPAAPNGVEWVHLHETRLAPTRES